jgi:hypothetical protein
MTAPTPSKQLRRAKSGHGAVARQLRLIALHESKLSLCLAGGFITPWPRGVAIDDQHEQAGRLVFDARPVPAASLRQAQAGLPYGCVILLEVDASLIRDLVQMTEPVFVLPLGATSRVLFPSEEALLEFQARNSGFGDVGTDLISLVVEPSAFPWHEPEVESERVSLDLPLSWETKEITAQGLTLPTGCSRKAFELLDREAGALATALAAARLGSSPELLDDLRSFLGATNRPMNGLPMAVSGIARALDCSEAQNEAGAVIDSVVEIVSTISIGDGIDGTDTLLKVRESLKATETGLPAAVGRFIDFSLDVLNARRDLPPNAFSDTDGSVTLRAVLLFLLNPDADRLAAIRVRNRGVGERVYCIAASLLGMHAGFASLTTEVKGGRALALAVPRITLEMTQGLSPLAMLRRSWDHASGECATWLECNGETLVRVTTECDRALRDFGALAASMGYRARFARESGDMFLEVTGGSRDLIVGVEPIAACPVFPRRAGLCLSTLLDERMPKKTAANLAASVSERSLQTGVFATAVPAERSAVLRLIATIVLPATADGILTAIAALQAAAPPESARAAGGPNSLQQGPPLDQTASSTTETCEVADHVSDPQAGEQNNRG